MGDPLGLYQHLVQKEMIELGDAMAEEANRDKHVCDITAEEMNKGQELLDGLLAKVGAVISPKDADAADAKVLPDYTEGMPPDWVLEAYMKQPVELTLQGTNVKYVNDDNYQREVFGSDRPVAVLFYVDSDAVIGIKGSRGFAAIIKSIVDNYSGIKFCAYKAGDGENISKSKFQELKDKYHINGMSSIAFYDNDKGPIAYEGDLYGGPMNLTEFRNSLKRTKDVIDNFILD